MAWFGSNRSIVELVSWSKRLKLYLAISLLIGIAVTLTTIYVSSTKLQWQVLPEYCKSGFFATIFNNAKSHYNLPSDDHSNNSSTTKNGILLADKYVYSIIKERAFDDKSLWVFLQFPGILGLIISIGILIFATTKDKNYMRAYERGICLRGPTLIKNPKQFTKIWPYIDSTKLDKLLLKLRLLKRPKPGLTYQVLNEDSRLVTLEFPPFIEDYHMAILGSTGAGKSTFLIQTLQQIIDRDEQVVIYDPVGEMAELFYDEDNGDWILNPFDERAPYFELRNEITSKNKEYRIAECIDMANAVFPESLGAGSNGNFFIAATRNVFAFLLKQNLTNKDLVTLMGKPESIIELAKNDPDAQEILSLLNANSHGQYSGIMGTLSLAANSLRLLPASGKRRFSFTEWAAKRGPGKIFITGTHDTRTALKHLHSIYFDLLVKKSMKDLHVSDKPPVWFILDELQTLEKLPSLETGLTESRKFNCHWIIGCQDKNQLDERYGIAIANTILAQPKTKLFLMTSEFNTAKWISNTVGEVELERLMPTDNTSTDKKGKSISYSTQRIVQPLLLPSEITGLRQLQGYLQIQNHIVKLQLHRRDLSKKAASFIPRREEDNDALIDLERKINAKVKTDNSAVKTPVSESKKEEPSKKSSENPTMTPTVNEKELKPTTVLEPKTEPKSETIKDSDEDSDIDLLY